MDSDFLNPFGSHAICGKKSNTNKPLMTKMPVFQSFYEVWTTQCHLQTGIYLAPRMHREFAHQLKWRPWYFYTPTCLNQNNRPVWLTDQPEKDRGCLSQVTELKGPGGNKQNAEELNSFYWLELRWVTQQSESCLWVMWITESSPLGVHKSIWSDKLQHKQEFSLLGLVCAVSEQQVRKQVNRQEIMSHESVKCLEFWMIGSGHVRPLEKFRWVKQENAAFVWLQSFTLVGSFPPCQDKVQNIIPNLYFPTLFPCVSATTWANLI